MLFVFEGRPSDSSFVEAIWRTETGSGVPPTFISRAGTNFEMVITKHQGITTLSVRGPETKASTAPIPKEAEFFGIVFKMGTFMPHLPNSDLVDHAIHLPEASRQSVWLNGSPWQLPDFENADTFVERLVRSEMLVRDPVVEAALQPDVIHRRHLADLSLRSVQRRFLRATGLTHNNIYQIQRANQAAELLEQGASILDAVDQLGYSDQPHLTRSLKRFIGQTPAQLIADSR